MIFSSSKNIENISNKTFTLLNPAKAGISPEAKLFNRVLKILVKIYSTSSLNFKKFWYGRKYYFQTT